MKHKDKLSIMVIGLGHHARCIYVPALYKNKDSHGLEICGVDLSPMKTLLESYLQERNIKIDVLYLDPFNERENLPEYVNKELNKIVKERNINAVIISTDPTTHKMYAKWALKKGLHILMDKPISTREGVVYDFQQAIKVEEDYQELLKLYNRLQQQKKTLFWVNTQRRYEIGYKKVFTLIKEATDKFNVPVTSIQSMHADGVWIFPDEMVEQKCHPYNEGYGKCSHSGFHLFDIVWQLYKAGKVNDKFADSAEVFTSFITPDGTLAQINQDDYQHYFGEDYKKRIRRTEEELQKIFNNYGENDAFSIIKLLNKNRNVCNISINLLHNSFSRRSWVEPNKDLYKGNGRIKHQYYHIQQGPFQCIQVHNYQSKEKYDDSNLNDFELGGNNHFDIYVFRNKKMFGGKAKSLEVIKLKDLVDQEMMSNKLYHEVVKDQLVLKFIASIRSEVRKEESVLNISSYQVPVQIMSSIYKSHSNYMNGKNPLIGFDIKDDE
jgi:hypothetical protein